jgi:predicted enzyme related to lactoylglutathione lyase
MKKILFFLLSILIFMICDIQYRISAQNQNEMKKEETKKGRVTGIGGIFFKSNDPEKSRQWYNKNLGLVTNEYGSLFEFRTGADPDKIGYLQWSPFPENTKYFDPSLKEFMINYRVENIEALVEELKSNGVNVLDSIETYDYGKFIHIMDQENNKIELWEPVDSVFTDTNEGKSTK